MLARLWLEGNSSRDNEPACARAVDRLLPGDLTLGSCCAEPDGNQRRYDVIRPLSPQEAAANGCKSALVAVASCLKATQGVSGEQDPSAYGKFLKAMKSKAVFLLMLSVYRRVSKQNRSAGIRSWPSLAFPFLSPQVIVYLREADGPALEP